MGLVDLPAEIKDWKPFFDKLRVTSPRGINITLLKQAVNRLTPRSKVGLKFRVMYLKHISDVVPLFQLNPAYPVIVVFDKGVALNRVIGGNHAVLLHSIDVIKERIRYIDPAAYSRSNPSTIDMDDFIKGWEQTGKQVIIPYPSNTRIPVNMKKKEIDLYQKKLRVKKK